MVFICTNENWHINICYTVSQAKTYNYYITSEYNSIIFCPFFEDLFHSFVCERERECVCVYTCVCRCPWKPEDTLGPLELESDICEPLNMGARI